MHSEIRRKGGKKKKKKERKKKKAPIFSLFVSGEMSHLCHKTLVQKSFKDS